MSPGVTPASRLVSRDASGTSCGAVSRSNHRRRQHVSGSLSGEPAAAGRRSRSSDSSYRIQAGVWRLRTSPAGAARVYGNPIFPSRAPQLRSCASLQAASLRSTRPLLRPRSQLWLCRSWVSKPQGPSFHVHRPLMLACSHSPSGASLAPGWQQLVKDEVQGEP